MTFSDFKSRLCNIDVSKKCFEFLAERISDPDYRGMQYSQHNRYDMDFIFTVLNELYAVSGREKLTIRTTDLRKRPYNLPEEADYAVYTNNLSRKLGRCTQDSIRKNLFVDLNRMGLIERFNTHGEKVYPYQNGVKKFVRISDLGLAFIKTTDLIEKSLLYTRAIDTLTQGLADELLNIVELDGFVTEHEFQFFLSYRGETLNSHRYALSELIEYIHEFRRLSKYQRDYAVKLVKEYCNPNEFHGNKTEKRDYHNWLNETQQLFMLMGQTAYFEACDNELRIRISRDSLFTNKEKLIRSAKEKAEYFKNHGVTKTKGFELHHIIPLCHAKCALEFSKLDVWENMLYIDGYKHSIITQSNNEYMRLSFDGKNVVLRNFADTPLNLEYEKNALYSTKNQDAMLSFNCAFLDSTSK